jgi:hypothetical protein
VLDERRMLDSVLAGIRIEAHEEFLFCAALNEDEESGGRLPLFLEERLSPAIRVGIPPPATFRMILQRHLPHGDDRWIEIYMKEFWKPREETVCSPAAATGRGHQASARDPGVPPENRSQAERNGTAHSRDAREGCNGEKDRFTGEAG